MEMNAWEVAGFVTGVVAVWLTAKESVWCWPAGLVNVGLYAVVFWRSKLYADMGLQLVFAGFCVYGWWEWLHGGPKGGKLAVERTSPKALLGLLALGAAAAALLGLALHRHTDASLPFWDAGTTAGSLVAQGLQTRKRIETWWFWIAVDVVYVGIYVVKGLYLTAVLYAIFLGLCVLGLVEWRRSLTAGGERAGAPAEAA